MDTSVERTPFGFPAAILQMGKLYPASDSIRGVHQATTEGGEDTERPSFSSAQGYQPQNDYSDSSLGGSSSVRWSSDSTSRLTPSSMSPSSGYGRSRTERSSRQENVDQREAYGSVSARQTSSRQPSASSSQAGSSRRRRPRTDRPPTTYDERQEAEAENEQSYQYPGSTTQVTGIPVQSDNRYVSSQPRYSSSYQQSPVYSVTSPPSDPRLAFTSSTSRAHSRMIDGKRIVNHNRDSRAHTMRNLKYNSIKRDERPMVSKLRLLKDNHTDSHTHRQLCTKTKHQIKAPMGNGRKTSSIMDNNSHIHKENLLGNSRRMDNMPHIRNTLHQILTIEPHPDIQLPILDGMGLKRTPRTFRLG
ncbi:hypothetical protein FGRMN_4394 [Fusarium graminum]|nr:hypothetical protein FGRMN_4394 [Fusarium graminum]